MYQDFHKTTPNAERSLYKEWSLFYSGLNPLTQNYILDLVAAVTWFWVKA